jgi:deoxycytidylate deaminase
VTLEHVDHPFPRRFLRRVSAQKGSAQECQNFRNGWCQNSRNLHSAEVHLLRTVYRNLFFLIGVLSVEKRRHERLKGQGMSPEDVAYLMDRDRNEPDEHGQHLDKTLELADFFIRNDRPNVEVMRTQLRRFVELMHGMNGVSPTRHEFGMYVAYASSLASACLSRQVGAAIVDHNGNVLGTGCNDVPRSGGGLYSAEAGADDARCVKQEGQRCWNDWHKMRLKEEIVTALRKSQAMDENAARKIADAVYATSRIKDLIEFSRAVHAEMEAVISVARKGMTGLVGATLYTTTFPCHSCARHVIAAGVAKVIYIQPYERSLALDLHGDSISLEPERAERPPQGTEARQRVEFLHFEGVAPRRYVSMFLPQSERKKDGVAVVYPLVSRRKAAPEYLDSYRDFEVKVVEHWNKISNEGGTAEAGA